MSKFTQTPEYVNFFEEIPAAEVPAPTGEPVTEVPPVSEDAPAPEAETPAAEEQQIPKSRFDEVYAEAKNNKRELDEVKAALAKIEESKVVPTPEPTDEAPELEPEAAAAIEKLLKSKGLMTKAEFEETRQAETAKIQLQSDVQELSGWADKEGLPKFDLESVGKYAKENGIEITSKASLKASYIAQNLDAITAAAIKRGVVSSETPKATAEKPGAATGKAPSAPDTGNKTLQQKIGDVLQSMNISG